MTICLIYSDTGTNPDYEWSNYAQYLIVFSVFNRFSTLFTKISKHPGEFSQKV